MSDKTVVSAIKKHLERQDDGWRFVMGREVLTAKQMIKKLNKDKKFRKLIVEMVVEQTVEILGKEPE